MVYWRYIGSIIGRSKGCTFRWLGLPTWNSVWLRSLSVISDVRLVIWACSFRLTNTACGGI